jgi:O-antigen ligase
MTSPATLERKDAGGGAGFSFAYLLLVGGLSFVCNAYPAASLAVAVLTLVIYALNRRLFFYSVFVAYPMMAQVIERQFSILGLTLNPSQVYGGIILLLSMIEAFRLFLLEGRQPDLLTLLTVLLCLYALGTAAFSISPQATLLGVAKLAAWLLLLAVSAQVFDKAEDIVPLSGLAMLSCWLIAGSVGLSALGVYGADNVRYGVDVAVAGFWNQVSYSMPLVTALPLVVAGLYFRRARPLTVLTLLVGLLAILLSYVRSAAVAAVLGYCFFVYLLLRYRVRRGLLGAVLTLLLVLAAAGLFVLLQPKTAGMRWVELYQNYESGHVEQLGSGRVGFLIESWQVFLKEPLVRKFFGNGYATSLLLLTVSRKVAHNDFIELLLGCGLVGLALYLAVLWRVYRSLVRLLRGGQDEQKLLGALAGMSFVIVVALHFHGIGGAVSALSISAIQIGMAVGLGRRLSAKGQKGG